MQFIIVTHVSMFCVSGSMSTKTGTCKSKINGRFSIENHRFSGAFLHYLCTFNRKFKNKDGVYVAIRNTQSCMRIAMIWPMSVMGEQMISSPGSGSR